MLERSGDYAFDHTLHEGSPIRMQYHFYGQSELPVAIQTWELPPGGFEGPHAHAAPERELEEIYIVLAGTGDMTVDGEVFRLTAGDSVLARVDADHDLRNVGDDTLRVLVIWGEPGTADYSAFGSARRAAAARGLTETTATEG